MTDRLQHPVISDAAAFLYIKFYLKEEHENGIGTDQNDTWHNERKGRRVQDRSRECTECNRQDGQITWNPAHRVGGLSIRGICQQVCRA